ncbi:hypothetical protein AX14_006118 [Amanita brunnescens Koide BX004]|nr:hypothetical protein AX14_006118 [Amanita brunnescens Koide BX004]
MAMDFSPSILREIFKNFSTSVVIHKPESFPWFLGHICAEWRRVFLFMTPQLWSNLSIDLRVSSAKKHFPHSSAHLERALDILRVCLKRSGGHPLSFSFSMCKSHYAEEYTYVVDMLDALIGQSMRWLTAELCLRDAELQRLHRAKEHTPLLRSLTLIRSDEPTWSSTPIAPVAERFADIFSNSPSLTQLQLSSITTWKFDWSSLLVLKLASTVDTKNLLKILPQATHLEELETSCMKGGILHLTPVHKVTGSVVIPSLKKLTLVDVAVLKTLVTPGLEYLSLHLFGSEGKSTVITDFMRQSSPLLQHLTFWSACPTILANILPLIQSLIRLEFHDDNLTWLREIVQLFNCDLSEAQSPSVPRLKVLCLSSQLQQELITDLSAMVASRARNPGVDCLQELVVSARKPRTKVTVDLTALQTSCEEYGVRLTINIS